MSELLLKRVLVVDDESAYRLMVQQFLSRAGYACESAADASEAIAILHRQPFDLVISDIVMPVMNGFQLAEKLRETRPEVKVIFMSGYTDDAIVHHGVLSAGAAFVQKPFTADALARKIREILDSIGG